MVQTAVVVSYRLGGDDGVSVEVRKWEWALRELGFDVRRVAGSIEDEGRAHDRIVTGLTIDALEPLDETALATALEGVDLFVVENICSLPLNVEAARATTRALAAASGRVVFHHHDLPWQRRSCAHLDREFPPRIPGALHVTINLRSRRELEARGFEAHTVHNYFDLDPAPGDRATRAAFGFADDDLVVLQPARAIERKNVAGGIRFTTRLAALLTDRAFQYWISGPAEDGYEPTLERLIAHCSVPATVGRAPTAADAYAACDVVVFPSTWEGFGNPVIESIAARRPCAAFRYPILSEILATGIRLFSTDEPEAVAKFLLDSPDARDRYYDVNLHRARLSYSIDELPAAVGAVLAS